MSKPSKTDPSDNESGDGDAFLSRWARRKRITRAGGDPDAAEKDARVDEEAPDVGDAGAGESTLRSADRDISELTDEDMPTVDSIDENTDMSGFFSPKVSQAVKKAALKKFFHNPAFNVVDGLDDYDDDFTAFAALGDIITSDMRGQMELEQRRAEEALAENEQAGEPPSLQEETPVAEQTEAVSEPQDEDTHAESDEVAADAPGITRDPTRRAKVGPGKLRRRDAGEVDT